MWLPLFNITLKLSVVILGSLRITHGREFCYMFKQTSMKCFIEVDITEYKVLW